MTTHATILVIDDDKNILRALQALFSAQRWTTLVATSVSEGLSIFMDYQIDVVLIDYHMPMINGLTGVEQLRQLDADIPILVLTADETQDVADLFLAAGSSDFAVKPIRAPDILSRINLHLRLAAQLRAQKNNPPQQTVEIPIFITKGIVQATLNCILDVLSQQTEHCSLSFIASNTGLAYQTVSRYLVYMVQEDIAEVISIPSKMGRPRQFYRLINPTQK